MLRVVGLCALVALAACAPEPTPLPAYIPPTATEQAAAPAVLPADGALRYALAANAAEAVPDLALIEQSAQVQQLTGEANPADLGSRYDVIAGYGALPGWEISPVTPTVGLLLNPARPPFDNPSVREIVRRSLNPEAIATALAIPGAQPALLEYVTPGEARTALANAGYPDGFATRLGYTPLPGTVQTAEALAAVGLAIRLVALDEAELEAALVGGQVNLALVSWTTPEGRAVWEARVGAENVLDLVTLPISYRAVDGLTITLSPGGWPLATR